MKETDWRNTLEVIVKGLAAVVVGLAGLYLLGWILSFLGGILLGLAGIILALLRWLVPVAIIVGVVYFAVTQLQPKPAAVAAAKPEAEKTVDADLKDEPESNSSQEVASSEKVESDLSQVDDKKPEA